jgi:hypothetical protein
MHERGHAGSGRENGAKVRYTSRLQGSGERIG